MRIQDTAVWNSPLVQETIAAIGDAGEITQAEDVNENPVMRVLMETECLDPLVIGVALADCRYVTSDLPQPVQETLELVNIDRIKEEGVAHLFAAGTPAPLCIILAGLAAESTGDAFREAMAGYDAKEMRPYVNSAADTVIGLADGLVDSGLWQQVPPRLVDKFLESAANIRGLLESPSRRKVLDTAVSDLKLAIAQATAAEMTGDACPPRIDPASQYEVCKNLAKTRYRIGGV